MHMAMHMRRFYLFIFAACLLIAAYPGREFVIRPSNVTILSWMRDQTITVVPVADFKPPVAEPIDPAKVRDLKHETGGIFFTQLNPFGFPRYGLAIYTFRYPYRGEMNWYGLEVKYRWWPRPGWVLRQPEIVTILGPLDESRLAALRKVSYLP
jgi:hypothetical protein